MSGWGGGGGCSWFFQLLMLSPNLLKSKIPYAKGFADNFLSFCHKIAPFQVLLVDYKWSLAHYVYGEP